MTEERVLITKAQIAKRWGKSRQFVHSRQIRHKDFPKEAERILVGGNALPLYDLEEIKLYERMHGEKIMVTEDQ